jgi:cell division protein FtsI (penicillin-binding protein 3)
VQETADHWQYTLRRRLLVAAVFLGLWVVGIEARLVYLQIYAHAELVAKAEEQQQSHRILPAERGDILDRHGRPLAMTAQVDSVYAVPSAMEDDEAVVTQLCQALTRCTSDERQTWRERFSNKKAAFAWVRRLVSEDEAARVKALDLPAIGLRKESRRFYPNDGLAAHLIGFVGRADDDVSLRGLGGLESAYEEEIRGRDGRIRYLVDVGGRPFGRIEQPATAGSTIELTIDETLQHIVERELAIGVREFKAIAGTVVVLDPWTGEILAMASWPTFNPNVFTRFKPDDRRNRAVQDMYEPGSTFKIVTLSAALDRKIVTPRTPVDTTGGRILIGRSRIVTDTSDHGMQDVGGVLQVSSNVGAIQIGKQVGTRTLGDYVKAFGFGKAISPDFPGESDGRVWDPSTWGEDTLASVSMGYEVQVTPLQMVAAISSIANGGRLIEPRIIRAVRRPTGRVEIRPRVLGRPVSPETAATMTTLLEAVVLPGGTATRAQVPGFTVAGKTGTAEKLVNGHYSGTDVHVSFTGFVPSREPRLAMIVMIDTPRNGKYGGTVAAPIFQRIAVRAMQYLGVPPSLNREPPVLVSEPRQPAPETMPVPYVPDQPRIVHVSAGVSPDALPDLRGLSARDVRNTLAALGLDLSIHGDGVVIAQDPPPGAPLVRGARATIRLGRLPASPRGGASAGQP